MRAVMFHGSGKPITLEEIPSPSCGDHDVIVRVRRASICGSDIAMTGDSPYVFPSGTLGHEFSGEVIEIGSKVTDRKIGQRVACLNSVPCGECPTCRGGLPRTCENRLRNSAGVQGQQGFSDYAVLHWRCAVPLPDSLSYADGALIEPMACGLHALRMAGLSHGDPVLVLGAGSMALSLIWWARRLGAGRILVASRSNSRRKQVLAFGADDLFVLSDYDAAEMERTLGSSPALVAECIGKAGMLQRAIEFVRPSGKVISMGMGMAMDPILPALASRKEATLMFPLAFTLAEFTETIQAFDLEKFSPACSVCEVIGLGEVPARIEAMRQTGGSGGKIQIDFAIG